MSRRFVVQYQSPKVMPDVSTCIIIANQAGDSKYLPATPVVRSFTYSKSASKINVKQMAPISDKGVFIYGTAARVNGIGGSATPLLITTSSPDICSVEDVYYTYTPEGTRATIRAIKNGSCSIKLIFPGDQVMLAATTTWSTTISGVIEVPAGSNTPQSITFAPLVDREYGGGLYLKATATSSLAITYKSLTPTICYILYPPAGAVVQAIYPLTGRESVNCIVEASQPGDNRYAPAQSIQQSFNWIKSAMQITVNRSTSLVGRGPHRIDAAVSFMDTTKMGGLRSLGHPLIVTSLTPTVCTVSSTAPSDQRGGIYSRTTVSSIANGTCTLNFSFAGTDDRKPTALQWSANVSRI
jgi:hypothetical protein